MDLIGQADFDAFEALIGEDAQDTFFTQPIVWRRKITRIDRYSEDNDQGLSEDIILLGLCNYNYMRSWPISRTTETGETDEQSIQLLFTKKHLRDQGYLNNQDYFVYDPGQDFFLIDGLLLKPMGDSSVSAIQDHSLLISIVVVRQSTLTGNSR